MIYKVLKLIAERNNTEHKYLIETPNLEPIQEIDKGLTLAGREIMIQFEKRENNEITVVGPVEEIMKVFGFDFATQIQSGYRFALKKKDTIRCNPKSYKYFANKCMYPKEVCSKIKEAIKVNKNTPLYFYRPGVFMMSEDETIRLLKSNLHFNDFEKYAKHVIKQQKMLHDAFGEEFNLDFNKMKLISKLIA